MSKPKTYTEITKIISNLSLDTQCEDLRLCENALVNSDWDYEKAKLLIDNTKILIKLKSDVQSICVKYKYTFEGNDELEFKRQVIDFIIHMTGVIASECSKGNIYDKLNNMSLSDIENMIVKSNYDINSLISSLLIKKDNIP